MGMLGIFLHSPLSPFFAKVHDPRYYSSFAFDGTAAMLEEFDKGFVHEFFCYIFQHGGHVFCTLALLGMIANQEYRRRKQCV